MKIVSIGQIVELNQILKEKNMPFIIHIRDACAGQSFFVESLNNAKEEQKHILYDTIEKYFSDNKMKVVYANDKVNFTIQ